jgi:hypothetical protein
MGKIGYSIWIGEFGWEIMTWQAYLRLKSREYDRMVISTFEGMESLYRDFHCPVDFLPHNHPGRALDWRDTSMVETEFDATQYTKPVEIIKPLKKYRLEGEFVRYGTPRGERFQILFHARGVQKCSFKNLPLAKWEGIATAFPNSASIGSKDDMLIPNTADLRGIPLDELMDLIAGAEVVVGGSSGVMHLATLCGTKQVVWGDNKTYFGEPLERRYKQTWNPFGTPVEWVECENWNPNLGDVISTIERGDTRHRPGDAILNATEEALSSERWILTASHIRPDGEILTAAEVRNFPEADSEQAAENAKAEILKNFGGEKKQEGGAALWE